MTTAARASFDQLILPLFEAAQGLWIDRARAAARRIACEKGSVNIDQVRAVCPPPADVDPRVLGAVFRKSEFRKIGYVNSDRRECHGRVVATFSLRKPPCRLSD